MNEPTVRPAQANPAQIWLFRHGETEWSAVGRHTGRNDLPLNETGKAQAKELAGRIAGERFDHVLCSPLQRAQQTCEIAGFLDQAELVPDAMEWNYGDYEGRTTAEIRQDRPGWLIWNDGVVGGETIEQVGERADRVLAECADVVTANGRVAIFAHGHFLRILAARWMQQPPILAERLALEPARLCKLGFQFETPVILTWNS